MHTVQLPVGILVFRNHHNGRKLNFRGNWNGDAVDVAHPVPAPDDETAAEPASAEPAQRGSVVQELGQAITLDNPTDRCHAD